MKVTLKPEYFMNANFTDNEDCALARAMKDQLPLDENSFYSVDPWHIYVTNRASFGDVKKYRITLVKIGRESFDKFGVDQFELAGETLGVKPKTVAYVEFEEVKE